MQSELRQPRARPSGRGRRASALLRALRRRREGGELAAPRAGSAGGTCGARSQHPEPEKKRNYAQGYSGVAHFPYCAERAGLSAHAPLTGFSPGSDPKRKGVNKRKGACVFVPVSLLISSCRLSCLMWICPALNSRLCWMTISSILKYLELVCKVKTQPNKKENIESTFGEMSQITWLSQ